MQVNPITDNEPSPPPPPLSEVGQEEIEEPDPKALQIEQSVLPKKKLVAENWRERIHFTLSLGNFSRVALFYQVFLSLVIWTSVFNFLISSLPQFWEMTITPLEVIEKTSVSIFTVDYILRLVTAEPGKRLQWVIHPMNIFDLLVIVPFYIEIILTHGADFNPADDSVLVIIRALRLFQMFRTVKIARHSTLIPVYMKALIKSKEGFVLFTFSITIFMVIVSAVMFYAEQTVMQFDLVKRTWIYPDGQISPFQSIPATFWWFMATITTVGYGDVYPHSDLGKFVASITMVGGLFVLAVPVAVFSSNFTSVWDDKMELKKLKQRNLLLAKLKGMDNEEISQRLELCSKKFSTKMSNLKTSLDKLVEDEKEIYTLMRALRMNLNTEQSGLMEVEMREKK